MAEFSLVKLTVSRIDDGNTTRSTGKFCRVLYSRTLLNVFKIEGSFIRAFSNRTEQNTIHGTRPNEGKNFASFGWVGGYRQSFSEKYSKMHKELHYDENPLLV
uniref:Uncharacterized protein n=1 Tax=Romanomermis culicivorax TaxID=13658 RepID=A0A915HGR2_ROMCU